MVFFLLGGRWHLPTNYYRSLDGSPVPDSAQGLAVRIGPGLAFLTKTWLTARAGLAHQQHYWKVLCVKPMSLRGIDDLMGRLGNPLYLISLDVF